MQQQAGAGQRCCPYLLGAGFHAYPEGAPHCPQERTFITVPDVEDEATWQRRMAEHLSDNDTTQRTDPNEAREIAALRQAPYVRTPEQIAKANKAAADWYRAIAEGRSIIQQ